MSVVWMWIKLKMLILSVLFDCIVIIDTLNLSVKSVS
jgi:hypothetical protein